MADNRHSRYIGFFLLLISLAVAAKAQQPVGNTGELLLNGQWEAGMDRVYDHVVSIPGIDADPAQMTDAVRWYRRKVVLPAGNWQEAVLELKGARFRPAVYINGVLIDQQEGGMAPLFFTLKHKDLRPGNAITLEIALTPLKQVPVTDASYIAVADQWRSNISSCLWDDVLLHFYSGYHLRSVVPVVDFRQQKAVVRFRIDTDRKKIANGMMCRIAVSGPSGKIVLQQNSPVASLTDSIVFSYKKKLLPWSPQHPNLYYLQLTLLNKDGSVADKVGMPYGIKNIEVRDKQFYLNDQPCKVSGGTVVWHRWVRSAAGVKLGYDTAWFYENVIRRLKEHGANYLRFHLGKPPERFLDLCDKYGLLVQYEWSFFHGMPASGESLRKQFPAWLDAAARHPSVTFLHPYNETDEGQLDTIWNVLNALLPQYPSWATEDRDQLHIHKYWWSLFENLGLYYDSYKQFPKAIMVDEFGGNYLDSLGNAGAYPTVKESLLRFLGREQTTDLRYAHQSASCSQVAEYWRRIGAAGFAPVFILSSDDDGNNWFMGNLKEANPKPVWNAMTAAWSPQSVSIELWDRNFVPGQSFTLPVYVFNDLDTTADLHIKIGITGPSGKSFFETSISAKLSPFSRQIKQQAIRLPEATGKYTVSAELLNPPAWVKYPVISKWDVHVFKPVIPASVQQSRIAVAADESELRSFLKGFNVTTVPLKDTAVDILLASLPTWKKIETGDTGLLNTFQQAIVSGKNIILLDIGDRHLGQGYPEKPGDLGPLQGVARVSDPRTVIYKLFGGIKIAFKEAAEPESHLQPDAHNKALWNGMPVENTWLWNGLRGGLIVPASDMLFSGLSQASFLAQWKARGADERLIQSDHYYAYELQGFYEYSSNGNDAAIKKKLKDKVNFLVQDAPSLAISINPDAPVQVTDLATEYANARESIAKALVPLASAGKNLTRVPAVLVDFGKDKGKMIASQLLTAGRLVNGFGENGLYGIRYDPVAAQVVLNMIDLILKNESHE